MSVRHELIRGVRSLLIALAFSAAISGGRDAYAWPPTYGAEFELTTREMLDAPSEPNNGWSLAGLERKHQLKFAEALKEYCKTAGCEVHEMTGKWDRRTLPTGERIGNSSEFLVSFPEPVDWYFQVSFDPGVVEVMTKPSTLEQLRAHRKIIDNAIFGVAKTSGLTTIRESEFTAGHFNAGARSSFDTPEQFLRYFIDYADHPELYSGVLGYDPTNAPPISALTNPQRNNLRTIVDEVNAGKITTIDALAKRIHLEVYGGGVFAAGAGHYQAFGMKKLVKDGFNYEDMPVELRAIAAQRGADDFIKIAELWEARIKYLNTIKTPIVFRNRGERVPGKRLMVTRFYIYVAECGLEDQWRRYAELMEPDMLKIQPSQFVRGKFDWRRPGLVKEILAHTDDLESSPWLRARTEAALRDAEIHAPLQYQRLVQALNDRAARSKGTAVKTALVEVVAASSQAGPVLPSIAACLKKQLIDASHKYTNWGATVARILR